MFGVHTTDRIGSPSASADGRRLKPGSSLPGDDPGRSPREKWGNPCFRVEGNYLTIPRGLRDLRKNAFENRGVAEVAEQFAEKTSEARSFRTASHLHGSWSGLAHASRSVKKERRNGLSRLPPDVVRGFRPPRASSVSPGPRWWARPSRGEGLFTGLLKAAAIPHENPLKWGRSTTGFNRFPFDVAGDFNPRRCRREKWGNSCFRAGGALFFVHAVGAVC